MTTKKQSSLQVSTQPMSVSLRTITVPIRAYPGSTLLMNKMSDETRNSMIDKVTGKAVDKKKIRDLNQECKDRVHYTDDGKPGLPATYFKGAIVEAATYDENLNKKIAKSIQVMGNVIPLVYKKQGINKAITYDSGMSKAPRETWRPEFHEWSCKVDVTFNSNIISPEQIVNLFKLAGAHIGVGAWRPYTLKSGGGSHGMFEIDGKNSIK